MLPLPIRHAVASRLRLSETELQLVPALMDTPGTLIDVGANAGVYALSAQRLRRRVDAFEPHPAMARTLRRLKGDIHVHEVALSDFSGVGTLHVPTAEGTEVASRSTLEDDVGERSPCREITVAVATLDSFDIRTAALLKIDVEGHEVAVLRGAEMTLDRCRCPVIVEVEDHRAPGALSAVASLLSEHRYAGYWCHGGRLRRVEDFDPIRHQSPGARPRPGDRKSPEYINNFVWLPTERPGVVDRVSRALR
jgi:FkbM family methyltransferase